MTDHTPKFLVLSCFVANPDGSPAKDCPPWRSAFLVSEIVAISENEHGVCFWLRGSGGEHRASNSFAEVMEALAILGCARFVDPKLPPVDLGPFRPPMTMSPQCSVVGDGGMGFPIRCTKHDGHVGRHSFDKA